MIKVRLEQGVYEVFSSKENMKAFNDKNINGFFVNCSPEENNCGFPFALVEKKDVIEVLEDD